MSEIEYVWVLLEGDPVENESIEGIFKSFYDGLHEFSKLIDHYTQDYQESFKKQTAERELLKETDYNKWCRYYSFSELKLYLNGPKENEDGDWQFSYGFGSGGGWVTLKKYELK